MSGKLKIATGLWINQEKGYLRGKTNEELTLPSGTVFMVYKNERRDDENKPTHYLKFAVPEEAGPPVDQGDVGFF